VAGSQDDGLAELGSAGGGQQWATEALNARQVKLLNRLPDGFEGRLTSSKWAALGRSTGYELNDLRGRGLEPG